MREQKFYMKITLESKKTTTCVKEFLLQNDTGEHWSILCATYKIHS